MRSFWLGLGGCVVAEFRCAGGVDGGERADSLVSVLPAESGSPPPHTRRSGERGRSTSGRFDLVVVNTKGYRVSSRQGVRVVSKPNALRLVRRGSR